MRVVQVTEAHRDPPRNDIVQEEHQATNARKTSSGSASHRGRGGGRLAEVPECCWVQAVTMGKLLARHVEQRSHDLWAPAPHPMRQEIQHNSTKSKQKMRSSLLPSPLRKRHMRRSRNDTASVGKPGAQIVGLALRPESRKPQHTRIPTMSRQPVSERQLLNRHS